MNEFESGEIYQIRETVFHRDIQTSRRELKYDAQTRGVDGVTKQCLEC